MLRVLQSLLHAVYAIREAATVNLSNLVKKFGSDWARVSCGSQMVACVLVCEQA